MRGFLAVMLLLLLGSEVRLEAGVPVVDAQYGAVMPFDRGILRYPNFTVRHASRHLLSRVDSRTPWVQEVFEVLDRNGRTIGGELRFTSAHRANARRFDVQGRIYIAEMFWSTGGAEGTGHRDLAANEIVVWDEGSARLGNPRLAGIWTRETAEVGARYSVENAYADGELLAGFDALTDLLPSHASDGSASIPRRTVPLVKWNDPQSVVPVATANYGERISIQHGGIRFPDFVLQRTAQNEWNPDDPRHATSGYQFVVFDTGGRPGGFGFSSGDLSNGRRITVGGKRYFVEMFATTARGSSAASASGRGLSPLRPDEIIVWDESSARAGNPAILEALTADPSSPDLLGAYAAGARLGTAFNGTHLFGTDGWTRLADLDAPPAPQKRAAVRFPPSLAGSGFVASVGGLLWLNTNGSVDRVVVTTGNDTLFRIPAQDALLRWTFTPPLRAGQPVKAFVSFQWTIAEPGLTDGFELY